MEWEMMTKSEKRTVVGIVAAAIIFTVTIMMGTWETCIAWGLGVIVGMTWITYWRNQQ